MSAGEPPDPEERPPRRRLRFLPRLAPRLRRRIDEQLTGSPLRRRLSSGFGWSVTGQLTTRVLGLAASFLVARLLGAASYGEFGIVQSTLAMFQTFAGFGLGLTATRFVSNLRQTEPRQTEEVVALSNAVAFLTGAAATTLLFLFASPLAARALGNPDLAPLLQLSALALLFGALDGAQTGALRGFESFRRLALIAIAVGILSPALFVAGALWKGLAGAVGALVLRFSLAWLLSARALRQVMVAEGLRWRLRGWTRQRHILLGFSLPATASGLLVVPVNWACNAILVNQQDGFAQMGLYTAANQWLQAMMLLPNTLSGVVLPILSEQLAGGDRRRAARTVLLAMGLNGGITLPVAVAGSLASPYIMTLYGSDFAAGWPTLVLVLATACALSVQAPIGQVIAASGRMWVGFLMNAGWAVAFLAGTLLMVRWGAAGLAGARLAAYLIHASWTFSWVWLQLRERPR